LIRSIYKTLNDILKIFLLYKIENLIIGKINFLNADEPYENKSFQIL